MLDRYIDPDEEELDPECPDFFFDEEPSEDASDIAEYNYECRVYGEPEKMIVWGF